MAHQRRDYPADVRELNLDAVQLDPAVLDAVRRFAASRPWRGSINRRKTKFRAAAMEICRAAGARSPRVVFDINQQRDSGRSCFAPASNTIILRGRLSVVTLLHEVAHLLHGSSERAAVAWSLAAFRAAFPREFEKLSFIGHMAFAQRR
jgi:hypothetical protein